ncbi:MAG: energy-coupling factor ABC transporter ATP-binding protein [Oscillospiraceae bacterium]|jgi:energy-coupling factor transport system ATP-binding protein|nr:energy-coupling factor ABC transporter ATP-binding protein [Oscillospiraceae bacterium]
MIIEARALFYEYPQTGFCLRDVSFTIAAGEAVALAGRNGSGKSTCAKLLCGLLKQKSGAVLFDGEDAAQWPLGRRGRKIGYLFQEPSRQLFAPTALEDLTFAPILNGMPPQEAGRRAEALLARFELSHIAQQGTYTLSRGEQQRLALCGLLMQEPAALALDEPTTGLDARRRDILLETIRECRRGGTSILLITHDSAFARQCAERELRLENGVLHAE